MNELKLVAIRDGITHFHTYADNYAIGYFAKHGFTKNLTMSRDRWSVYVCIYSIVWMFFLVERRKSVLWKKNMAHLFCAGFFLIKGFF